MKVELLPQSFTKAPNHLPSLFTQVKRNEFAAMYRREDPETGNLISYEVFAVHVVPAGDIFGKVHGDYEQYPGSAAFGRTAWDCKDFAAADDIFEELTKGKGNRKSGQSDEPVKVRISKGNGKRGKAKTIRPEVKWPKKTFTMKDLFGLNTSGWTQPTLYVRVQELLGSKVEVAERKSMGKGRPTVFYRVK